MPIYKNRNESDQEKIERLKKLDKGNRDRSKKYLEKVKKDGKKQISAFLDAQAYEELTRRRDASIQAGKPLSYGHIIKSALFQGVNTNDNLNGNTNIDIGIDTNVNIDKTKKPNWKKQKPEYAEYLKEILLGLDPGQWKKQADILNQKKIWTARGKKWTANNLALTVKRIKK
jgi:hypothetical protein